MITTAIAAGPQGFEQRTFECRKCGHSETGMMAYDPLESGSGGGIADEFRAPN